jgi:nucleotide-binding universal stress UspA family protein
MSYQKILVPLDGSPLAEAALPTAAEFAAGGASILLLRAVEAHTLPGLDPSAAQVEVVQEAEDYLAGIKVRLEGKGVRRVETSVWYGPAALAIVEAARLRRIDLVVMCTHGRSGLGRLIVGSVAESVLRGTAVPILLLRAPEAPVEPPQGAVLAREASRV